MVFGGTPSRESNSHRCQIFDNSQAWNWFLSSPRSRRPRPKACPPSCRKRTRREDSPLCSTSWSWFSLRTSWWKCVTSLAVAKMQGIYLWYKANYLYTNYTKSLYNTWGDVGRRYRWQSLPTEIRKYLLRYLIWTRTLWIKEKQNDHCAYNVLWMVTLGRKI